MWIPLETLLGPGINHLAGERGGVGAGGRESQEEGREGPSRLSNSQTPSESGSSSFAVRKASFAETDAMPQLSPDVLCISAAFEHIAGSRLESQALMFTVGPQPSWLCVAASEAGECWVWALHWERVALGDFTI